MRGRAIVDEDVPSGVLVVRVEDVTMADAPSIVIAEARREVAGGRSFVFELDVPDPPPGRDWQVSAFLDVDRDGRPSAGDFVSPGARAVPPARSRRPIEIRLTKIPAAG